MRHCSNTVLLTFLRKSERQLQFAFNTNHLNLNLIQFSRVAALLANVGHRLLEFLQALLQQCNLLLRFLAHRFTVLKAAPN